MVLTQSRRFELILHYIRVIILRLEREAPPQDTSGLLTCCLTVGIHPHYIHCTDHSTVGEWWGEGGHVALHSLDIHGLTHCSL